MSLARQFRSSLLAVAIVAMSLPAFSQQAAQPVDNTTLSTADSYAVRASIDKFMEALSARDEKAAEGFIEEGALGMYSGAAADYDRATFLRSLALTFKTQGEKGSWANEVEEITGSGDMAVVRSKRTLTRSADGGAAGSVVLRLLEVYTRYSDGSWKLSRFAGFPG